MGYDPPSREQQGLYWVWMAQIGEHLEMEPTAVHDGLKRILNQGDSTMKMHKTQYADYMTAVEEWCEENEIQLTERNEED